MKNVWFTSDGQLIFLALKAARKLGIGINVLWSSTRSSVFSALNHATNGVIVPSMKDHQWKIVPNWTHRPSLELFARLVWEWNPVTTEWENIPIETLETLTKLWLISRPNIEVLRQIQDRVTEKELVKKSRGTPVPFVEVNSLEELIAGIKTLEPPCILKTRAGGYDGKWQWEIEEQTDLGAFWNEHFRESNKPMILEKMIDLDYEVSVIIWMDHEGWAEALGPIYNIHENGILRYSIDPAPIDDQKADKIRKEALRIAKNLSAQVGKYVWLLTIEFFVDKNWTLYVNEFAPRPHNSGHASLDSRKFNQNHLWMLSVSGDLVVPSTLQQPVVMCNILSQRELAQELERRRKIGIFYDYHKLIWEPDPHNNSIRKLWHVNHRWSDIENLIGSYRTWQIGHDNFLKRIKALNQYKI